MKVIGITGGIGSGKSTIARVFHSFGIPVFDSDAVAKRIYPSHPELVQKMESHLSITITTPLGIDLSELRDKIFSDEDALRWVESQVHPLVLKEFNWWCGTQRAPYVIRESAILFPSGSHADCDATIAVVADELLRIHRVMQRSGLSKSDVAARMMRQWTDDQICAHADFVISNNDQSRVLKRISELHAYFLGANCASSPDKY